MAVSEGALMQHPGYGLPRIPLPRTPVNRSWTLLRGCALHGVKHLLRLGQEIIELGSRIADDADGYRLTLHALQDDCSGLVPLPSEPRTRIGELEEGYLVLRGILAYDPVELHTLDSSYAGWFGFGGFKVRVMLEPSDQLTWGWHRLNLPRRSARIVDPLQFTEVEEGDPCH